MSAFWLIVFFADMSSGRMKGLTWKRHCGNRLSRFFNGTFSSYLRNYKFTILTTGFCITNCQNHFPAVNFLRNFTVANLHKNLPFAVFLQLTESSQSVDDTLRR